MLPWPEVALSAGRFVDPIANFVNDVVGLNPILGQLLVFGFLLGGIYALMALGLSLIFGVMDVINFAHGAFLIIGTYAVWFLTTTFGVNPFLTVPVAVLIVFLLGVATHLATVEPVMESEHSTQLVVIFGVYLLLQSLVEMTFSPDPRSVDSGLGSINLGGIYFPEGQILALAVAAVAMVVTWTFLQRTKLGRAIRGTADNVSGAESVGINVGRINYLTFGLGCALAGLAGATLPFFQDFTPFTANGYLIVAFVCVVLGGLGSLPGAFLGGMIIGLVEVFSGYYLPGTTNQVIIFLVFITILVLRPSGLLGGETA